MKSSMREGTKTFIIDPLAVVVVAVENPTATVDST